MDGKEKIIGDDRIRTGYIDIKGAAIRNNDIIKVTEVINGNNSRRKAVVGYIGDERCIYNPNCCIRCKNKEGAIAPLEEFYGSCKIIGNIFDTPNFTTNG